MISIITPTILERAAQLEECKASVAALQGRGLGIEHIIIGDGPAGGAHYCLAQRTGNAAAPVMVGQYMAKHDWRMILPDDDYLVGDGVLQLMELAIRQDLDFAMGEVALSAEEARNGPWFNAGYPLQPGTTEGFIFHKRLLAVAHLEPKGWGDSSGGSVVGMDYTMLDKWVRSGAKYACPSIHLLVHR